MSNSRFDMNSDRNIIDKLIHFISAKACNVKSSYKKSKKYQVIKKGKSTETLHSISLFVHFIYLVVIIKFPMKYKFVWFLFFKNVNCFMRFCDH